MQRRKKGAGKKGEEGKHEEAASFCKWASKVFSDNRKSGCMKRKLMGATFLCSH